MASRYPRSTDLQLFATLVDNKEDRDIASTFRGKDAATVVDAIDGVGRFWSFLVVRLTAPAFLFVLKALKENGVSDEIKHLVLQLLQKLAGDSRQVPKSYLVGTLTNYRVEKAVFASSGFADIRQGKLRGMTVAVKTIRAQGRINMVHEARETPACSIFTGRSK